MALDDWKVGDPVGLGDVFKAADNIGKLVAFVEPAKTEEVTKFGPQEATKCRYIVVIDSGENGVVYDNSIVWGNLARDAYSDGMEQIIAGRIVQGEAKSGQNPPFFLEAANELEKAQIIAWFESNASRNNAGRILIG